MTRLSILLTGQSGTGKSYLATYIVQTIKSKRKWVVDPSGEYYFPNFFQFEVTYDNYEIIPEVVKKYRNIVFQFFLAPEDTGKIVNYLCHHAFYTKNVFMTFEECHIYIDKLHPERWILLTATMGRKFGISSLYITQRPGMLNTTIRSQTNIKITGRMTDPSDLDAVRPFFTNYHLIPSLRDRTFLVHLPDGREKIFTTEGLVLQHYG